MSRPSKRQFRRARRDVHGIVLLDKPLGISSNQALLAVRGIFQAAKAGHTGSLDPLASGLLPICLGEATKVAGLLLGSRKAYEAECWLGVTTNTDDGEGQVVERKPVPEMDQNTVSGHLEAFIGSIDQIPPAYSALKRDGVPMYVRARRGEDIELQPRPVQIHAIELLQFDGERLRLRVECGSGTYIRSLARDLGARIGCGAHLSALRRIWVQPFRDPQMHTLEDLRERAGQGLADLDAVLLPIDKGLQTLTRMDLDASQAAAISHGQTIPSPEMKAGMYRVYDPQGRLLALAQAGPEGLLRVQRGFNLPPEAGIDA
ncbi:tRNA pseudouridine(55) synthase TruB [Oleiagrimonas sp.]|jgi:tRNA pseudouridine55 synthase|uniref:tRNA pseudouridine(55) synthase TruB n=1 Tax=Oleiagrimonas sp. TaxID=2010330 RepID=UPI0026115D2C|nr:tRNA pseudouridine(55) synthase TruB [Oleiagrimonas sp.]MDA3912593.1 tRNA pseudouridine(55) synthase TruB [Oleiagrimonas sp.]